jgi:transcriptional regulator with XRE-family HTH domain
MTTNKVLEARKRLGLQQKTLAELTGLSVDKLSKIESGTRGIKPPELIALSYALGVAPSELVGHPAQAQLRAAEDAAMPGVRQALEIFDRFIDNCGFLDALMALDEA